MSAPLPQMDLATVSAIGVWIAKDHPADHEIATVVSAALGIPRGARLWHVTGTVLATRESRSYLSQVPLREITYVVITVDTTLDAETEAEAATEALRQAGRGFAACSWQTPPCIQEVR